MKNLFNFGYLLILVFCLSCSWSKFNPFSSDVTTDKVINNFDLDDDMIEKFSTKEVEKEESEIETIEDDAETKTEGAGSKVKKVEKSTDKTTVKKTSSNKSKKSSKKSTTKTKKKVAAKPEATKKTVEKISSKSSASGINYPADYPEEFKKLDIKSKQLWTKVKPNFNINEQTHLDIYYLGVVVGKIAIVVKPKKVINGNEVYHFWAKLKSAPFYKYVYTLDDVIESYVDVNSFLPYKYSLIQRESKQSIDDVQLFDREKLQTYFRMKKVKRGDKSFKKIDTFIPFFSQDALSALFMIKSLPLNMGDKYEIPMVTRGKISIMTIEVQGKETISTSLGKRNAFRLAAHTKYSGDLVKSGSMTYWISADEDRIFLKFKAKIKLGSVEGEAIEYKK